MKFLIVVSCLLAVACAKPGVLAPFVAPVAYSAVAPASSFGYSTVSHHGVPAYYTAPVAHTAYAAHYPVAYTAPLAYSTPVVAPLVAPVAVEKTQYHAQDIFGQATYGHAEAYQSHNAVQDAAGNKVGAYSYVAPSGEVISTRYVADALGYRVESNAAPTAPAETPEVVAARTAHLKAVEEVKSRSRRAAAFVAPTVYSYPYAYSHPYAYSAPVAYTQYTPVTVARTSAYNTVINTPFAHTSSFNVKTY